jgi:uncharacterized protein
MNSPSVNVPRMPLEIRGARVSSVIVQRVPVDRVEQFLEWQRGVARAVQDFAGYQATDIYPPPDPKELEWVAVIHFDNRENLQRWLDSPARAEWTERLLREIGDFQLKTLPVGFGSWFAGQVMTADAPPPPSWKMALTVLLGLYPTVMLIAILVGPYIYPLGLAWSMLISNALSVCICQWAVMPALTAFIAPWLNANTSAKRAFSIGGLFLILLVLGGLALLFHQVKG